MTKENNPPAGGKKTAEAINPLQVGATIEGKVVARDRSSLFIDLGIHGTGIIYGREFYSVKDVIKNLDIGDKVFAKIVEVENDEGYRELSLRDATKEISWQRLKELKDSGQILSVRITGVNKGGLLTAIDNIQAFLPVSQLAPEHYPRVIDADKQKILKELQKFIGKTLEVKILDLLAQENKLILSEKAKSEEKTKETLKNYSKGDTIDGEITGIADFGAFIKFPFPAENKKQYKKSDVINGKVTKFSAFGAFVEIMPKIRSLCHISEFESKEKMEEQLKLGETYDFQVLLIEPKEHRMSLKLVAK